VIHRHLVSDQPKRQIHVRHRSSLFSRPEGYNTFLTDQVTPKNYFLTSGVTSTERIAVQAVQNVQPLSDPFKTLNRSKTL
jgi:hypothetical protein